MRAPRLTACRVQGSIHRNFDLLLRHRLHIVGEARARTACASAPAERVRCCTAQVNLKVNHCLLALPGVKREEIKRVMSHPQARAVRGAPTMQALSRPRVRQALSQCDGYLTRMGVVKEAVDDTAGAAKAISQQQLRCVSLRQ
jgi:arogenate/prephenate dehydratase